LNRFLEDDRALVTDIAGTTRDSIEERFRLGDHLFRITDTAGLRKSNDKVEKLGIERSWRLMSEGHIILFLIDPLTSVKKNILELEKDIKLKAPSAHLVKILTKSDLWNGENYHLDYPECIEIGIGSGLSQIKSKLSSIIDKTEWNGNSEILIANIRHAKALKTAFDSILKAEKCLHDDSSGEIISYELRDALESLGSITGEIIADDLLSSVFSRFCIGK
jgi:tRNA modification GTPase